jgi:antitoxin ParD1/3/4
VVREALRLLEQRELEDQARLEWLQAAAQEGIDDFERGDYYEFHSAQDIRDFVRAAGKEAAAKSPRRTDRRLKA